MSAKATKPSAKHTFTTNPPDEPQEEPLELLKNSIDVQFCTSAQDILLQLENFDLGLTKRQAEDVIRQFVAIRRAEQANWDLTDCDRVDAAFDDLNQRGIVAEQHYLCCGSCGHHHLSEEVDRRRNAGERLKGYVFYHAQFTDDAVEHGELYLAYGAAVDYDPKETASVGRETVSALRRQGLEVQWNGKPTRTILVKLKDWRKRLRVVG